MQGYSHVWVAAEVVDDVVAKLSGQVLCEDDALRVCDSLEVLQQVDLQHGVYGCV